VTPRDPVSPHAAAAAAAVTPAAAAAIERLERLSGSARYVGNPAAAAAVAVAAAGAATKYAAAAAEAAAAGSGGGVRDGGALNSSHLYSSQTLKLSWNEDSCAADNQSLPFVRFPAKLTLDASTQFWWGGQTGIRICLDVIDGRSYKLQCDQTFVHGSLNMYGRGSINSTIMTRPRHAPSPFAPLTRTA